MKIFKYFLLWGFIFYTSSLEAQWIWQNPKPTGQDINDASFSSSQIGWFVGENGTIFKTEDGGLKWFSQFTLPRYDFRAISAINENEAWALSSGDGDSTGFSGNLYGFKILKTENGGTTWVTKLDFANEADREYLSDIFFIDDHNGWIGGNHGLLMSTEDGGENWNYNFTPTDDYPVQKIQFFNNDTGYISSGKLYITEFLFPEDFSYSFGKILRTFDGGENWQPIFDDTIMIEDFYFLNLDTGWAIGQSVWTSNGSNHFTNYIFYTYDGGNNWHEGQCVIDTVMPPLNCIYFKDTNTGFAGGYYGWMLNSTDGGRNWTKSNVAQRYIYQISCIVFTDEDNGYMFGSNGAIWQSKDGGLNWENYDTKFVDGVITDVYFATPDTGWFIIDVYTGFLYGTTDGGDTWNYKNLYGIWAIDFPDLQNGWAVGDSGKILFTDNLGQSWQNQNSPTIEKLEDVKFFNNKIGWAVGRKIIIKTINGGNTWNILSQDNGGTEIRLQDSLRLSVLYQTNVRTDDGGTTWLPLGEISPRFYLNPDTGWGFSAGDLFRTYDGGQSWNNLGNSYGAFNFFVSLKKGWSMMTSALYTTEDGGSTWKNTVEFDPGDIMNDFYFIDDEHGWFVGSSGAIIRYGYPEKVDTIHLPEILNPENCILYQNYPNPFNGSTTISFYIDIPARVSLNIFDIQGKKVKTIIKNKISTGYNTQLWYGINEANINVSSGIYFYTIIVESLDKNQHILFSETKKLILLK